MILHLCTGAGHLPYCPLLLQMYYNLRLEVTTVGDCTLSAGQWPGQMGHSVHEQIAIDSSGGMAGTDLCSHSRLRGETTGVGGLQAMDVPSHLFPFLPTLAPPIPACSLFLAFQLCNSPSLTAGLVSWVCF